MQDEARQRDAVAQQKYARVRSAASGSAPSALARVAGRRAAELAIAGDEPDQAVELLFENLAMLSRRPAPAEPIAAAEDELAAALTSAGRLDEARRVYSHSAVDVEDLTPAGRAFRLRTTFACGSDDGDLLARVVLDDDGLVAEHVLATVAEAASAGEVADRPLPYDVLVPLVERALADVSGQPPKQLATCAKRLGQAGRHAEAERCWRLLWLGRRRTYGETDPLTLKTRVHLAGALGAAGRLEEASREYEWLVAATQGEPVQPKSPRWAILSGYAELARRTGTDKDEADPVLRELRAAKRRLKEHAV